MSADKVLQYLSLFFAAANVGAAAFVAAIPAGMQTPWWLLPTVLAVNAIAHMIPGSATPPPPTSQPKV